jgi:hypothetical protein
MFLFENVIKETDSRLFEKLRIELPLIMLKCVLSYHEMVTLHGEKGIWDTISNGETLLPAMAFKARRQFLSVCSPFIAFFESGRVCFDPAYKMTVAALMLELHSFLREQNSKVRPPRVDRVSCGTLFMAYNIRFISEKDDTGLMTEVLVGLRLPEDSSSG